MLARAYWFIGLCADSAEYVYSVVGLTLFALQISQISYSFLCQIEWPGSNWRWRTDFLHVDDGSFFF